MSVDSATTDARRSRATRGADRPCPTRAADCCAIVVHYRCPDDLAACLHSLREHVPELPVVVVDNGSGDGSLDRLRAELSECERVELVAAPDNRGFASGCNLGIDRALERRPALRYVVLLNPDTLVTPGFLDCLLQTADRHPDAGAVGGRVVSLDGRRVLYENGRIRPWTLSRSHVPAPAGRTEFETAFVTGASMLLDADLLRDGLRFDERYFLYVEDMDLCAAVRARGRTLWVNTDAVIRHREGGSQTGELPVFGDLRATQLRHMTRGKVYFARKHLGFVQRLCFVAVASLFKPLVGAVCGRSLRFVPAYYRGLWEGLWTPIDRTDPGDR